MFAPDGSVHIDRAQLLAKADEIDRTIIRLRAMRDGLRHAAACPAPSHMECPTFRRMLRIAGARRSRRPAQEMPARNASRLPRNEASGACRKRRA